jgi:GWxTD domain-containing protein
MPPRDGRPGPGHDRPDFVFFEALNLVTTDPTLARIDVHYRINTDFFVPITNNDPSFPWNFKRRGEILIELLDSTDISRAREINRIEVGAEGSEQNSNRKDWYLGMASFTVPPGPYTLIVEIDDLESEREFLDRNTIVRARTFGSAPFEASTPLLVEWTDSTAASKTLVPQSFGGNLPFGKNSALYLELITSMPPDAPVQLGYTLETVADRQESPEVLLRDTAAQVQTLPGAILVQKNQKNAIAYSIEASRAKNVTGVLIPFHSEKLPLRAFELNLVVKEGSLQTSVKKPIRMVWPEMPFSLRDVEFALDALRHITTKQQLDSLKLGSFRTQRDNLEAFWKAKDPTPETSYNELMVQYYQRVDHAMKAFGLMREPDGSKSDRGHIYILYGQPTRVDRTLSATAGFQEIWVYENLNKRFVFLDESKSGNYVLVSTQSL